MKPSLMLSVACVAVSACVTTKTVVATEPQATAADYFRLAPGTGWDYEVEQLGDVHAFKVTMVRQNAEGYFEDSTGAMLLADEHGVRDQKRYLLRNPVAVGTQWTNVVSVSSVEHYQILSAGQPCLTRAGSWADCVVIESRNRIEVGKELINEFTLARGVGIVRLATVLDHEGKRIPQSHLELVKLSPSP